MTVAIVDYGSGNLRSAAKAIERAAREAGADDRVLVTSNPREVADADRVVLPGVGAFADCRAGLYGVPGMVDTLQRAVIEQGKPFLGICVGMQLMGWNELSALKPHALLDGIAPRDHAYFVHSFQLKASRAETVLAMTDYGGPIIADSGVTNHRAGAFMPYSPQESLACACARCCPAIPRQVAPSTTPSPSA